MRLHGIFPAEKDGDDRRVQFQNAEITVKTLRRYQLQLLDNPSVKKADHLVSCIVKLSLNVIDHANDRFLLLNVLKSIHACLNSVSGMSPSTIESILAILTKYFLTLDSRNVTLDVRTARVWINVLNATMLSFHHTRGRKHLRTAGLLLMDSIPILPMNDPEISREWQACFETFIWSVMHRSTSPRIQLACFLDVINRLTQIPHHPSLMVDLFTAWSRLRLNQRIGTELLKDDTFERVIITTSGLYQDKEAIIELQGSTTYQNLHVLLMQLAFWGWHTSATTSGFFRRIMIQLDHFRLLDDDATSKIGNAAFFDPRWDLNIQQRLLRALRLLIDRCKACGIKQGTEVLMERFLEEIFCKMSPRTLNSTTARTDFYRILEWLLKGTWSWERPISTAWRLVIHSEDNPQHVLAEFLEFLRHVDEHPFQSVLHDGGRQFFNLKHEAIISLLRAILEDDSLDQTTAVMLMAQVLEEAHEFFPERHRSHVMRDIREWFAKQGNIDPTTKILTLMCA